MRSIILAPDEFMDDEILIYGACRVLLLLPQVLNKGSQIKGEQKEHTHACIVSAWTYTDKSCMAIDMDL